MRHVDFEFVQCRVQTEKKTTPPIHIYSLSLGDKYDKILLVNEKHDKKKTLETLLLFLGLVKEISF